MDFLTVKEAAELKGCSERYIKKLAKEGKLEAEMRMDQSIRQMRYMIPISALPEALQAKWYKRQKAAAGLLPEVKEPPPEKAVKQKKPQRTFEELSEAERREVTLWTAILQEWQGLRANYSSKTEFDKLYVGKCQLDHPDVKVSVDILYRKYAAYKAKDMEGLIDKRGAWNKGKSTIPAPVWDAFLWFWLDENRPTASLCYRETIRWTAEFYPELVNLIPTERCFRRHIDNDLSVALKTLMRDGEKAFLDRCAPYIMRMYDKLEANDCWIADNHTFDVISLNGEVKHRLYLTAFLDAKSGVLVGWNITESPDSQSTILALRHGIMRFGIPKCIYVDNGREFLPFDFGGKGHRAKKNHNSHLDPTTILKRLDIEMRNAIVRNAKAKPVERTFRTVKEQFSKLFSGFCGGTILERPESLKRRVKNGQLPYDYEVRELLDRQNDNVLILGNDERKAETIFIFNLLCTLMKQMTQHKTNSISLIMVTTATDLYNFAMKFPKYIKIYTTSDLLTDAVTSGTDYLFVFGLHAFSSMKFAVDDPYKKVNMTSQASGGIIIGDVPVQQEVSVNYSSDGEMLRSAIDNSACNVIIWHNDAMNLANMFGTTANFPSFNNKFLHKICLPMSAKDSELFLGTDSGSKLSNFAVVYKFLNNEKILRIYNRFESKYLNKMMNKLDELSES